MGGSIPLGQGTYQRTDLPPVRLKNMMFESAPTNLEDQVALIPRPRLKAFAKAGDGPMKGLYRRGGVLAAVALSGSIIAKSGTDLYRVTQTGLPGVGTAVLIGSIDGDYRMTAEGNENIIVLTAGADPYLTNGTTVSAIAMPDDKQVSAVDTLDSYFLLASDLGRFYWIEPGETTVSALNFATAESQPDVLLSLKVIGDELWLVGRLSVEVWQPTGDLDLPFQRINGRIFGIGVTARETVQKLSVNGVDTMCWLGTDRRVYRTDPNPVRISDEGLEEILQKITISLTAGGDNPYATVDSWNGHDNYVLHIPGHSSVAYDLLTKRWHERTSFGLDLFRGSVSAVGPNAQPLIGDSTSNQIWEMTVDSRTDGDDPVIFEFSGLLEVTAAAARLDNVSLDLGAGLTMDPENDPSIQMAMSDDEGLTYGDGIEVPLGRQGQRLTPVAWTRLGLMERPGKAFRWRTTEPVTVRKAKYNTALR